MFRIWKRKAEILLAERPRADGSDRTAFESLPYIDNESLDQFLSDPVNIERLPVDPTKYSPDIQRMIVSAFFHEASTQAKQIETV